MDGLEKLGTHQKALSINLDATVFGSFAEIGAGQEVARWFLRVGGASGTVAKTISAYDKEVSDDLYGAGTRYVSKPRLQAMLESEWHQLIGQLQDSRGAATKFFSFVDTVSARNFSGTNDCNGWVGLRFQQQPGGCPSDVILHVNLRDSTNLRQQEAVGILGVNLLYASQHALGDANSFLASVFEDLGLQRVEIDCVELSGPAFEGWDRSELQAFLVTGGFAEAVVFSTGSEFVPPNELLYKRAIVFAPGRFDSVELLHGEFIAATLAQLPKDELKESKGGIGLFCLSSSGTGFVEKKTPPAEIVTHVNELLKLGYGVMVFRARELYTMSAYVNRYTKLRVHFAIGLSVMVRVLMDSYKDLPGTLLEGIARLFAQNVHLSVFPMTVEDAENRAKIAGLAGWTWEQTNGLIYADKIHPGEPLDHLYKYLLASGMILPQRGSETRPAE